MIAEDNEDRHLCQRRDLLLRITSTASGCGRLDSDDATDTFWIG